MLYDPVSTGTHAIGALGAAIATVFLVRKGLRCQTEQRAASVISLAVFGLSAVVLLSASATYHSLHPLIRAKPLFLRLDHAAIFVLIAGTFTPIHTIAFKGFMRWGFLGIIWTCAVAGVTLKTVFFDEIPYWVGITTYLAMGWVGLLAMVVLCRRHSLRYVSPLILGGLAYSAGALCEFTGQPVIWRGYIESHEVFHVAVLVGLGSMWMFIRRLAAGEPALPAEAASADDRLREPKPLPSRAEATAG